MGTRLARFAIALIAALSLSNPLSAEEREYAVGQVWAYDTAPEDKGSLIQIREIEQIGPPDQAMTVYHISMSGVSVGQDVPIGLGHLPVSHATLDASVTGLVADAPPFDDYTEGKAEWEEANGGVFTISLMEIAEIIRSQVAPRMRQAS
ncbi:MAG: hypothetical protein C0472_01940 [Erythrobacter sp.]|nr:hypothetical protein [Erythrobacter sp.]